MLEASSTVMDERESNIRYHADVRMRNAALTPKQSTKWRYESPVRLRRKISRLAEKMNCQGALGAQVEKYADEKCFGETEAVPDEYLSSSFEKKENHPSSFKEEILAAAAVDTWAIDVNDLKVAASAEALCLEQQRQMMSVDGCHIDCGSQLLLADQESPSMVLCRICEEDVELSDLEEHSKYCEIADECDAEGLKINQRLSSLAEAIISLSCYHNKTTATRRPDVSGDTRRALDGCTNTVVNCVPDSCSGPFCSARDSDDPSSERLRGNTVGWATEKEASARAASIISSGNSSPITVGCSSLVSSCVSDSPRGSSPKSRFEDPVDYDSVQLVRSEGKSPEEWRMMSELGSMAAEAASLTRNGILTAERLTHLIANLKDLMRRGKIFASISVFGNRIDTLLRDKLRLLHIVTDGESMGPQSDDEEMYESGRSSQSTPVHPIFAQRQLRKLSIKDFHILKRISKGAFGRVFLAKKKKTGDLYAIKVLRKSDMLRKNVVESVQAERNILCSTNSPFVVRLYFSFTCQSNLYLVMEYLNGGDMYSLLQNMGCLEEHIAQQYIAELVLALQYMHSLGVIHRDLKPDNLLIASDGHIKLTDFGLSKIGVVSSGGGFTEPWSLKTHSCHFPGSMASSTYASLQETVFSRKSLYSRVHGRSLSVPSSPISQVGPTSPLRQWHTEDNKVLSEAKQPALGTPDYLAPEILLGADHGPAADWWSVGIILFELLTGRPPFNAPTPQEIFDNIISHQIHWPAVGEMSPEARDLIESLLAPDPKERLGYKGADEVMQHPFFWNVKWDSLLWEKAAFVPAPDDPTDTSYFTARDMWTAEDEKEDPGSDDQSMEDTKQPGRGIHNEPATARGATPANNLFSNFTYKNLQHLATMNHSIVGCSSGCSPRREFGSPVLRSQVRCHSVYNSPHREYNHLPRGHHSQHASPSHRSFKGI